MREKVNAAAWVVRSRQTAWREAFLPLCKLQVEHRVAGFRVAVKSYYESAHKDFVTALVLEPCGIIIASRRL